MLMNIAELIKANTIMNTIYTRETFTQCVPHAHRSVELVYVASGCVGMDTYPVGTQRTEEMSHIDVLAGQFFLIDSFVPHLQYVPERAHMMILEIDTRHKTAYPKDVLLSSSFASSCKPVVNLCKSLNGFLLFRDNRDVFSVFSELLRLLYNKYHTHTDEYFETDLELSLKRLIVEICKCQKLTYLGKKHNAYVAKALSFLDSHYSEPIRPERVEPLLGISLHQLNIYLKNELKQSFNQLLTDKRLDSAKNLLKSTNYPIGTVATKTGYASLRHFEAAFKKKFHVTPTEFRRNSEEQGFVFWTDAEDLTRVMEDFRICLQEER